jgi:hypothetical protein
MADDITVTADQKPAVLKVGPWQTFEYFNKDGALWGHMETPTDGVKQCVIDTDEEHYPLTIKFKQHDAPEPEVAIDNTPENAHQLN